MVTFGHQVVTDNDEYVDLVDKAASLTVAPGAPGSTPPDFVPFRKLRSLEKKTLKLLNLIRTISRSTTHSSVVSRGWTITSCKKYERACANPFRNAIYFC